MVKKSIFSSFILIVTLLSACGTTKTTSTDAVSGATKVKVVKGNSLYHNTETTKLKAGELFVTGEVQQPGKVDFRKMYPREVFVKETLLNSENKPDFRGAFRYSGYSLFDVLNEFILKKKNAEIFRPEIDLYIKVENNAGEYVVFSWSEIFHTISPHQIIIATEVAPIKPHKKEVSYATGTTWKLVAANDLFSLRNLENPSKITVFSFDKKTYTINRDLKPFYSPETRVISETKAGSKNFVIPQPVKPELITRYNSTFYGMGQGYHPIPEFDGILLQNALKESMNLTDPTAIAKGLVCFASIDGYRSIFSYSELFNRADQSLPQLTIVDDQNEGGYFRIFQPTDFYADRSVKGLKEIYIFEQE